MKYTLERGQAIVAELRAILVKNEYDADEYLPLKSDAPFITRLGGLMHDTCNTANLAAVRIIEAKNEAGIATFGREAWEALPPEERETFDALCFNHTRQLPVAAYDRLSKEELSVLLKDFAEEVRAKFGPTARVELDGPSFMRSVSKLLDARCALPARAPHFPHQL